jgi:hypothetical protein
MLVRVTPSLSGASLSCTGTIRAIFMVSHIFSPSAHHVNTTPPGIMFMYVRLAIWQTEVDAISPGERA